MAEAAEQAPDQAASPSQPGNYVDPYAAYTFRMEIGNQVAGYFTECSGLGARVVAIQWRAGDDSRRVHRLPGRLEYADVTLRYGLTASPQMWEWFTHVMAGQADRRNVSIILLDSRDQEVMRWNLYDAWPTEWRGSPLDALGQEVAIESLTLVFEGLDRSASQAGASAA
jgi:phage tail-like protein